MKRIEQTGNGRPDQVVRCVETEDVGQPEGNEVVVAIRAAAINPADLLIMEGRYPGPTEFPARIGIEGAGEVVAVGPDVAGLAPGDRVMSLGRENWAEKVRADAAQFIKLPQEIDWRDAAQIKANPPSAHLMLETYVDLEPGDWVIQNAANSAVGRHIIRLAKARGCRTVNVVRRDSLIAELQALGGDSVLVDGDDLAERVREAIGRTARLPLAIDAIGGTSCMRLAACLSDGGTVVNYGFLSGEPCMITPEQAVVHGITLTGFWLVGFMRSASREEIEALYDRMARHFIDGDLVVPVEAEYSLDEISEAVAHAHAEARNGKILLRPSP
ncbi:MAG TPA: zinc-dependent alcohol dehydrogenase family protein [Afifellaceae bacterium]|nr:zinc-dependent alcohol dehydrogenase family protein [Afifellaceae bacterium]